MRNDACLKPAAEPALPVVLVVEDDALTRLCIAEHLRDVGYSVIEAMNGDEALSIYESSILIDVLFTDVRMPGSTDGIQLAQWAREHCPDTHIILTSACFPNGSTLEALDGIAFVSKPYQPEWVAGLIRAELEKETTNKIPGVSAGALSGAAIIDAVEAPRITVIAAWRQ